jgi:translation initiation factor IF-3
MNTAEHDLQFKLNQAKAFLEKGHKVKCNVKAKPNTPMKEVVPAAQALQRRVSEFARIEFPDRRTKFPRGQLSFYLTPLE